MMTYEEGYFELLAERSGLKAKNKTLLAALESIISLDLCCATLEEKHKADPIFTAARAAIAKAKGEK